MSELKKTQNISDQTSTDKILEEEERILQNVVETKGKIKNRDFYF
jgi:hypothetical protein